MLHSLPPHWRNKMRFKVIDIILYLTSTSTFNLKHSTNWKRKWKIEKKFKRTFDGTRIKRIPCGNDMQATTWKAKQKEEEEEYFMFSLF